MRILLTTLFFCSVFIITSPKMLWAQENTTEKETSFYQKKEDSLNILVDKMFHDKFPEKRMKSGFSFAKVLYKTLRQPGSFQYHFDSLGRQIHIIYPEDKSFRIFNWLVRVDRHIVRYYGIIQTKDSLYPLTNYSDRLMHSKTLLTEVLDARHWFGVAYYQILTRREKGINYYFLLGVNVNGSYSNKKILDVLHFSEKGPVFGAPVFEFPSKGGQLGLQYRILWQYSKRAAFTLKYDDHIKMIAFDDLHSKISDPLRKDTYVPTSKVNGLKWENGHWLFVENAIEPLKLKDGQAPINGVIQK